MMKYLLSGAVLAVASTAACAATTDGMVITESRSDVVQTTDRAVAAIKARGLKLFARIDHAAGARKVGLKLRPTVLLLFGNPKVGTPLMQCNQTVAIDLPQKLLIWEGKHGVTHVAYNAPAWLNARHGLADCTKVLGKVSKALSGIAAAATR